jgi:DNA-binding NtrC family response regulator
MTGTVLIVDDEVQLVRHIERLLQSEGYQTVGVYDGAAALRVVADFFPDVALVDLRLPDIDGTTLMTQLRGVHPAARYIIVTAHSSIRSAVEAMRLGASNYLTKPFEPDELLLAVDNAIRERLRDEELRLRRNAGRPAQLPRSDKPCPAERILEYPSEAMRSTLIRARNAAARDTIILLLGESGSGKDFLARYIHDHSKRFDGPFFTINCAAVSTQLAESELFGHEPGAFTGARGRKRGLLELAQNGTLLLNEVGELSPMLQAKLLTFLDTRTFTRVGGEKEISVDARLLAATNRLLEREVAEGKFRKDLFYRLNVFSMEVPSLRERTEDIPILVKEILGSLSEEMVLPTAARVDSAAMQALRSYTWPGNVRELRNVLERAIILSSGGLVGASCLAIGEDQGEWSVTVGFPRDRSIHDVADEVKCSLIKEALRRSHGNKQEAARLLGVSRHALAHQVKSLALHEPEPLK